jgi:hypothetical protein
VADKLGLVACSQLEGVCKQEQLLACVLWVACSPKGVCKQEQLVACVLWVACSPKEVCKQEELVA